MDKLEQLEARLAAYQLIVGALLYASPEAAQNLKIMAASADELTLPTGLTEAQRAAVKEDLAQTLSSLAHAQNLEFQARTNPPAA